LDKLTSLINDKIHEQYKSIRAFSDKTGIPQSTLSSALKSGIGNTNFATVCLICKHLNIELDNSLTSFSPTPNLIEKIDMYESLDEDGRNKVDSTIKHIK